jgi:hypothetical protein
MSERGKKERMKNIFKKLHIGGSNNHDPNRSNDTPPRVPSPTDDAQSSAAAASTVTPSSSSPSATGVAAAASGGGGGLSAMVNRQDFFSSEEEFQVQLALAISASNSEFRGGDDPEKDQIHAATMLSLGGNRIDSTQSKDDVAEALSRQYWVSFVDFLN